jgi:mono/diheme cytochrome c family protein
VEVAAIMWNHAPTMWEDMAFVGYRASELTPRDAADLLAFLFVAGYLEEPGNPQRGRAVIAQMGCQDCHMTGEGELETGPDLALWSSTANPILWAQRLWNHAPRMEQAMEAEGIEWPELTPGQVVDVLAYLRTIGTGSRQVPELPGDPWSGRILFRQRCQSCHSAEGEGGDVGPDLGASDATGSLSGFAASLWNHAPAMGERMKELGIDRPTFTEKEMADLVTYLFAIRYFAAPGDAEAGEEVYLRNCGFCHGEAGAGGVGPGLRALGARSSATFMAATLWNHGPRMYQEMQRQGREWPRFEVNEMRDLIEYLRSLP